MAIIYRPKGSIMSIRQLNQEHIIRLDEHIVNNMNGVEQSCYIYKNNEIIATGRNYNPLETPYPYGNPFRTYVFANKNAFWKKGPYPIGEGGGIYQHVIYDDGTETFHVPDETRGGSVEYNRETGEIVSKSICYFDELVPDFGLPAPISSIDEVINWMIHFSPEDNPLSWEAYVCPK